jgi:hypothetical protein
VRAELDALWQPDADVQAVLDSACAAIEAAALSAAGT